MYASCYLWIAYMPEHTNSKFEPNTTFALTLHLQRNNTKATSYNEAISAQDSMYLQTVLTLEI